MKIIRSFIVLMYLFISSSLMAQTDTIKIEGYVVDLDKFPISGAVVQCGTQTLIPDSVGYFSFSKQTDSLILHIDAISYEPIKKVYTSSTSEPDSIVLSEIVIILNRFMCGVDYDISPTLSVESIYSSTINSENNLNLAPILNSRPGIYMQSGALNTNRISIRGIGARSPYSTSKIRAYLNDIPITSGSGETALEDFEIGFMDELVITKGPNSYKHGASLGGTVELKKGINRDFLLQSSARSYENWEYQYKYFPDKHGSFSTQYTGGSFGLFHSLHKFQFSSRKLYAFLGFSHSERKGFRENSSFDRQNGLALLTYNTDPRGSLSVLANITYLEAFIPSSIDSTTYAEHPERAASNWLAYKGNESYKKIISGLSYKRSDFDEGLKTSASIFFSYRDSEELRPFNFLQEESKQFGGRLSLGGKIFKGNKSETKWSAGGEFFKEFYDWSTFENINLGQTIGQALSINEEDRMYYNTFAGISYEKKKTYINIGLNFNQTNYEYWDEFNYPDSLANSYAYKPVISPYIELRYLFFSLQAGHGFNTPSLEETLNPDGQINPAIKPESGWNVETGFHYFNNKLKVDASIFSMFVKDLLVARRTAEDQYIGLNAGRTLHTGLETSFSYSFVRSSSENEFVKNLNLNGSYSYAHYRFIEFIDDEADYSGNQLTGIPPHKLSLALDLETQGGIYGNLNFLFTDAMPMRDDNSIYSDAYRIFNTKLGFKKIFRKRILFDAHVGLSNLLNEKYASMVLVNAVAFGSNAPRYYYPGDPTNFYAGIGLEVLLFKP